MSHPPLKVLLIVRQVWEISICRLRSPHPTLSPQAGRGSHSFQLTDERSRCPAGDHNLQRREGISIRELRHLSSQHLVEIPQHTILPMNPPYVVDFRSTQSKQGNQKKAPSPFRERVGVRAAASNNSPLPDEERETNQSAPHPRFVGSSRHSTSCVFLSPAVGRTNNSSCVAMCSTVCRASIWSKSPSSSPALGWNGKASTKRPPVSRRTRRPYALPGWR